MQIRGVTIDQRPRASRPLRGGSSTPCVALIRLGYEGSGAKPSWKVVRAGVSRSFVFLFPPENNTNIPPRPIIHTKHLGSRRPGILTSPWYWNLARE